MFFDFVGFEWMESVFYIMKKGGETCNAFDVLILGFVDVGRGLIEVTFTILIRFSSQEKIKYV